MNTLKSAQIQNSSQNLQTEFEMEGLFGFYRVRVDKFGVTKTVRLGPWRNRVFLEWQQIEFVEVGTSDAAPQLILPVLLSWVKIGNRATQIFLGRAEFNRKKWREFLETLFSLKPELRPESPDDE